VPDETASTAVLVGFHRDVMGYSLCLMLLSENVLWWGIDGSVINLVCQMAQRSTDLQEMESENLVTTKSLYISLLAAVNP